MVAYPSSEEQTKVGVLNSYVGFSPFGHNAVHLDCHKEAFAHVMAVAYRRIDHQAWAFQDHVDHS